MARREGRRAEAQRQLAHEHVEATLSEAEQRRREAHEARQAADELRRDAQKAMAAAESAIERQRLV
ncbi:MAG: protein TolA, partial [Pseudomonadota bacterium]|nr:protein TolA [Pseudomonadota bacterium]